MLQRENRKMLGYDRNTVLEFNYKRNCGLWLLLIGAVILISVVFGGTFLLNPVIFLVGYYLCFYIVNINRAVRKKLSAGTCSPFQIRIIYVSVAVLFLLMFLIAGPFIPSWNWRMIWLGVTLATGLHFVLFYFVHGKSMLILAALCSLTAVAGYLLPRVPFWIFGGADGVIKVLFGMYLLFFSRPTKTVNTMARC